MNLDHPRLLLIRLFFLAALVLVPPLAYFATESLQEFEQAVTPELNVKAAAIGRDLKSQVERAVGYGIPFDRLVGMDEFLGSVLIANPEIRYLAASDADGRVLFVQGIVERGMLETRYRATDFEISPAGRTAIIGDYLDLALPVRIDRSRVGNLHVGMDSGVVRSHLLDICLDMLAVAAAALIVAFEILAFVVAFNVTGPLARAGLVMDRGRRGDFTHVPGSSSDDDVGLFLKGMTKLLRQADDLYRRLMAYAGEVKDAHFDKGAIDGVAGVEQRVNFLFRFSPSGVAQSLCSTQGADIRLPLFLFVFAEEIGRAFMPLYAESLAPSPEGMPVEMLMALPLSLFMAGMVLALPWAGALTTRFGARAVFLGGVVPSVLGYLMTALARGVFDFCIWRVVTGIGYAVVTMAALGYVARSAVPEKLARGMGVYVGAVASAAICGATVGGVLAERGGFRITFLVSAALVLLAGLLVARLLGSVQENTVDASASASADNADGEPKRNSPWRLLCNWRFTVLMLLGSLPAKAVLSGFVFFLMPVALSRHGMDFEIDDIARTMVLYPLTVALASPLAARLSDRLGRRVELVAVGALIGGAGLLSPLALDGVSALVTATVALGVAQGLISAPLLALLPDLCWTECRTLGAARVLAFARAMERLGSVAGPVLAAALLLRWDVPEAMILAGAGVSGAAVLFAAASLAYRPGPHIEAEEDAA